MNEISKEVYQKREKRLKTLRIIFIVIDVLALIYLIYQIINKDVYIFSYVPLLLGNIMVFIAKPDSL